MNLKIFKGYERFSENYPAEAVKYAMEHREEAIPELLEILDDTLSDVENLAKDENYLVHFPAIYILAFFRETKAYEKIIRIASLPDEQIYDLLGDTVTEDFKNILASVCDGNIEPIKEIIENSSLDEYVRTEALESLLILLNHGMVSREQLVFYFKQLFNGKLEVDYSNVWDRLPTCCSLIHPAGLVYEIEQAVADGKVMEIIADLNFMHDQLAKKVEQVLDELKEDGDYSFVSEKDVYALEGWVGKPFDEDEDDVFWFNDDEDFEDDDEDFEDDEDYDEDEDYEDDMEDEGFASDFFDRGRDGDDVINVPFRRESFVGRNDPCPCGSGKKYKKCCLGKKQEE